MSALIPFEDALARCGVAENAAEAPEVLTLLNAVSAEIREMTRRAFEGAAACYDVVYDVAGGALTLPHVPVTDLLSVRAVAWDGTEDDIYDPTDVTGGASTTLAASAAAAATNLKVASVALLSVGKHLRVGSAATREVHRVTAVGTAGAGGTGVTVEPALRFAQVSSAVVVEVSGSTSWRLAEAARGRLELRGSPSYARVSYRVSGEIPSYISQAASDWIASRWTERGRSGGQTSYATGKDSETWDARVAGTPPGDVARALGLAWHPSRNGVI